MSQFEHTNYKAVCFLEDMSVLDAARYTVGDCGCAVAHWFCFRERRQWQAEVPNARVQVDGALQKEPVLLPPPEKRRRITSKKAAGEQVSTTPGLTPTETPRRGSVSACQAVSADPVGAKRGGPSGQTQGGKRPRRGTLPTPKAKPRPAPSATGSISAKATASTNSVMPPAAQLPPAVTATERQQRQ